MCLNSLQLHRLPLFMITGIFPQASSAAAWVRRRSGLLLSHVAWGSVVWANHDVTSSLECDAGFVITFAPGRCNAAVLMCLPHRTLGVQTTMLSLMGLSWQSVAPLRA